MSPLTSFFVRERPSEQCRHCVETLLLPVRGSVMPSPTNSSLEHTARPLPVCHMQGPLHAGSRQASPPHTGYRTEEQAIQERGWLCASGTLLSLALLFKTREQSQPLCERSKTLEKRTTMSVLLEAFPIVPEEPWKAQTGNFCRRKKGI